MNTNLSLQDFKQMLVYLEQQNLPFLNDEEKVKQMKCGQISSLLDNHQNFWKNGKVIDFGINNDTLLHWGTRQNLWLVCSTLVNKGEDPYKTNDSGKNSITLARDISEEFKEKIFNITKKSLNITPNITPKVETFETPKNQSNSNNLNNLFSDVIKIKDRKSFDQTVKLIKKQDITNYFKLQENGKSSCIHEAAYVNNKWFISWAIGKGIVSLLQKDEDGNTFAHLLAIYGDDECPYLPITQSLLDEQNNERKTVLHLMATHNRVKTLSNIHGFEHGLQRYPSKDYNGNTYYHDGARSGSTEFLKLIWEKTTGEKAKKLKESHRGFKDYEVDYTQISHFNLTNDSGQNILHIAVEANQEETLRYLLNLPDMISLIHCEDNNGKKPSDYNPELFQKVCNSLGL